MEQRSLRPCPTLEPPHSVYHMIHEEFLDRPYPRAVCPNLVPEILEGVRVFSREDDVLGKEAVPASVETDGGFPLLRLWSCGVERVRLISGLLSFARHGFRVPLIRYFPDTEVVGRDLPSLGVPRQRNSIAADSLAAKTAKCWPRWAETRCLCSSRRTSAVVGCRI